MATVPPNPEVTYYVLGKSLPSSSLERSFTDNVLSEAKRHFKNIVPTTYEASKVYLDKERLKPEGQRNLLREMCMIMAIGIPNNEGVVFKSDISKTLIELVSGVILFYPTADLHPTSFGTLDNQKNTRLLNKKTLEPTQAMIALAYFSRSGGPGDDDILMPDGPPEIYRMNDAPLR